MKARGKENLKRWVMLEWVGNQIKWLSYSREGCVWNWLYSGRKTSRKV